VLGRDAVRRKVVFFLFDYYYLFILLQWEWAVSISANCKVQSLCISPSVWQNRAKKQYSRNKNNLKIFGGIWRGGGPTHVLLTFHLSGLVCVALHDISANMTTWVWWLAPLNSSRLQHVILHFNVVLVIHLITFI
jgi:hypothetical protein